MSNGVTLPAQGEARSGAGTIAIRPERVRLTDGAGVLTGTIQVSTFVSGQMIYRVVLPGGKELTVKEADSGAARAIGASVGVDWHPSDIVILRD